MFALPSPLPKFKNYLDIETVYNARHFLDIQTQKDIYTAGTWPINGVNSLTECLNT